MKLLLDEDSQRKILVRLLRDAGHDVLTVTEAELESFEDSLILARACAEQRVVLSRNARDFLAIHREQPVHPGILIEYQDSDRSKNMSADALTRAITNLEASGCDLRGQLVAVNAWCYGLACPPAQEED